MCISQLAAKNRYTADSWSLRQHQLIHSSPQTFKLTLRCDTSATATDPTFVSYTAGVLALEWASPDVCAKNSGDGGDSMPADGSDGSSSGGWGFFGFLKFVFWMGFLGLILYFAIGEFDLVRLHGMWRDVVIGRCSRVQTETDAQASSTIISSTRPVDGILSHTAISGESSRRSCRIWWDTCSTMSEGAVAEVGTIRWDSVGRVSLSRHATHLSCRTRWCRWAVR